MNPKLSANNLIAAVTKYGTDAVLRYRRMANPRYDNEVREEFISCFIASQLSDQFLPYFVHVERPYETIADDRSIKLSATQRNDLGGLRADIAIYRSSIPIAIIEIKKFDESVTLKSIRSDFDKARTTLVVPRYVGVLVCETNSRKLKERKQALTNGIIQTFHYAKPEKARPPQDWKWCFGCAEA